jgi:hypothetical protein
MRLSASLRLATVCCLLAALAGCSANFHTVFRKTALDGETKTLVAVDAKQRVIVANGGKTCAEPSPDVFAVIAQSLSAGGTFSKAANPASVQAALNLAFGSAEQASTIPRTQTVNMLRELMYRTCERALNKDIGGLEMPIQAVRDQRLMVSVLAIEQLTGAVTPKPVSIGASGSASQSSGEAVIRVDDARKESEASAAAVGKAQTDYNNLNVAVAEGSADRVCDVIATKKKGGKDLTDDEKLKEPECTTAATGLADAKARQARAQAHEADLRRMITSLGGSVTTATTVSAPGGLDQAETDLNQVAEAVGKIVALNFSDSSEFLLFCMKSPNEEGLTATDKQRLQNMQSECATYVKAAFTAKADEESRLAAASRLQTAQYEAEVVAKSNQTFEQYWPTLRERLRSNGGSLSEGLRSQMDPADVEKANCFATTGPNEKEKAKACFQSLPGSSRLKMITGDK